MIRGLVSAGVSGVVVDVEVVANVVVAVVGAIFVTFLLLPIACCWLHF